MNNSTSRSFVRSLLLAIACYLGTLAPVDHWGGPVEAFSQCPPAICSKPFAEVTSMAVMSPLCLGDLLNGTKCDGNSQSFSDDLKKAKELGATAVSVDVWWGLVEKSGDNRFNWDYYDQVVRLINDAGLHWVPILSFHACGTNVGDDCYVPIPPWIWTRYQNQGILPEDLKYRSEKNNYNDETVSLWMDTVAMKQYEEFMTAFVKHYGQMPGVPQMTDEINISLGPAGELRYPSYNTHDGYNWPHRGYFQAYSNPARKDFRRYVTNKYQNINQVNKKWKTSLTSARQISPPQDDSPVAGQATSFVNRRDYEKTQYGRDFIDWYNGALVDHGSRMLATAVKTIKGPFANTPIGMKIPGIHWQMCNDSPTPRIAEITAGLIRTSEDNRSDLTGHGYKKIMEMVAQTNAKHKTNLHFTCLEMDNRSCTANEGYSEAKALVFWVAQAAAKAGVTIKGENALSGEIKNHQGWNNIENAFCYAPYTGLTVLRVSDVSRNDIARDRFKCLTDRVKPMRPLPGGQ